MAQVVLSCTASFVLDATPSQTYFRAFQLRENLAADNDAMSRTALQNIYEIIRVRDQHVLAHGASTGTAAAIATAYSVVRAAEGRDNVSAGFVDTALTVHNPPVIPCSDRPTFAGLG